MPAGRPPMGPKLVERFDASDDAKRKLKVILETVTGETSIPDACLKLGIAETRFYQLRDGVLRAGLAELEPGTIGRPRKEKVYGESDVEALRKRMAELEQELVLSRTRTSIAAAFPHLVKEEGTEKKTD